PDDPDHAYEFTGDIQYAVATWNQTGSGVPTPTVSDPIGILAVQPESVLNGAIADSVASARNDFTQFRSLRSDGLRVQDSAGNNIGAGYSYFGGGLTFGLSRTTTDMIDINGDGLPDMVKRVPGSTQMSVAYNRGDTFTGEQFWDVPAWPASQDGLLHQAET